MTAEVEPMQTDSVVLRFSEFFVSLLRVLGSNEKIIINCRAMKIYHTKKTLTETQMIFVHGSDI